jgi:hypothetical protein
VAALSREYHRGAMPCASSALPNRIETLEIVGGIARLCAVLILDDQRETL